MFSNNELIEKSQDLAFKTTSCMVCSATADNEYILKCRNSLEDKFLSLYQCTNCKSYFYFPLNPFDYAITEQPDYMVKFYVELGAGIDSIIRPLTKVAGNFPANSKMLDVGCGFGYGLDFMVNQLSWSGIGAEPSKYGREGAKLLNLDIRQEFTNNIKDLKEQSMDLVFASEVIEHVPNPVEFCSHLKTFLKTKGILILTTPNAALITKLPEQEALNLLSPGHHIFLLNKSSFEHCLNKAGFKHIFIEEAGYSLVAYAAAESIELNNSINTALYLNYLKKKVNNTEKSSYVWIGFSFRLLKELVNMGRLKEAEEISQKIKVAYPQIFAKNSLSKILDYKEFKSFIQNYPACMSLILYYDAMLSLLLRNQHALAAEGFENCYEISSFLMELKDFTGPEISYMLPFACYHAGLAYSYIKNRKKALYYFKKIKDEYFRYMPESHLKIVKDYYAQNQS